MDRQTDINTPPRINSRKQALSLIAKNYTSQLTPGTIVTLLQIQGLIPLGGQSKHSCFSFIEGKSFAGLDETLAFQIHTFFNEEVAYTLYDVISPSEEYDVLKFLVEQFNTTLNIDMALKITPPCYIPALKVQIHYAALIEFTKRTTELLDALKIEVWNQYLYKPANYAQTSFVRLLLGKYYKYWDDIKNNLHNLDPKSSCITSMLNSVGISKARIIKDNHPESELSVNQLIPFMRWEERWNEHGRPLLEARVIINYFSEIATPTEAQRFDIALWLSRYPKWLKEHTYFDYETGNEHHSQIVKVRIHNHNVLDHITLPKYNGKVNLKIHPKDWLLQSRSDGLNTLIENTYKFLNKGVILERRYADRIIKHYPHGEVTYLGSGQMLIDESVRMVNCVDGYRYVYSMVNGDDHFYHLAKSTEDDHGMTIQVNIKSRSMPFAMVREAKGYDNRSLNDEECEYIAEFLSNIYFPDMTMNQVRLLIEHGK